MEYRFPHNDPVVKQIVDKAVAAEKAKKEQTPEEKSEPENVKG